MSKASQQIIVTWFVLDALLILCPLGYALLSGVRAALFGLPFVVLYFIATGAFVVFSIVCAYLIESREGEIA